MCELMNAYEAAYGSKEKIFLRMLGGDPDEVCRRVEELEAEAEELEANNSLFSVPAEYSFGHTTPEQDLHGEIMKEINRLYFSSIPRESALAICNALGELGEFTPCATIPGLTFNDSTFMYAWNEANPDKKPLQRNGAAWFSV